MLPTRPGWRPEASAPARPGPTTIVTAAWIYSSPATCTSTSTNCPTSERMRKTAASRESQCSADPGACSANPICSSTTAATAHLKKYPKKLVSTTPTNTMAWEQSGATTTTTDGPICTWPTIPVRIIFTTTSTTELSRKSACSQERPSAAMVQSAATWEWIGATTCTTVACPCL